MYTQISFIDNANPECIKSTLFKKLYHNEGMSLHRLKVSNKGGVTKVLYIFTPYNNIENTIDTFLYQHIIMFALGLDVAYVDSL